MSTSPGDSSTERRVDELSARLARLTGQLGGLTGWANTEDRQGRMEHVRRSSPAHIGWHAKRLGLDPDHLTEDQLARCKTEKKRYYAELRKKGALAVKHKRAEKFRAKAALLDQEAAELGVAGETA